MNHGSLMLKFNLTQKQFWFCVRMIAAGFVAIYCISSITYNIAEPVEEEAVFHKTGSTMQFIVYFVLFYCSSHCPILLTAHCVESG